MDCRIDSEMRLWFMGPIILLWLGIALTGFDVAHWLLYVPAILALVAFVTGRCPGMLIIRGGKKLFNKADK